VAIAVREELNAKRCAEIGQLTQEIEHVSTVLPITPSDRLDKRPERTQAAVATLRGEVKLLREEPLKVTKAGSAEIGKLCEQINVPPRLRPRSVGRDLDAQSAFLRRTLEWKGKRIQ
jgi:hypothetical protein